MKAYQFTGLLQNEKWILPAFIQLDENGKVLSISEKEEQGVLYERINGYALPGMQNAHSHAFQYAMVGLTEQHDVSSKRDDFWGWRNAMYQLALSVNPEQMEAIAAMLYMEMLRHGYTQVAEFHYVHHQPSGQSYDHVAELGERLIAAAKKVGIKITLIPILYQNGGFGKPAGLDQRRFLSKDRDAYMQLWEASKRATQYYEEARIAYGVHSLRAVEPEEIQSLLPQLETTYPVHLHISEQLKEVDASLAYLGKRPVEWLLDSVELDSRHHLVHATHINESETDRLAKTEASVVLCPSTEGNLGDGIFPLKRFQAAGGNWSIGTDSHIGINPFEELRMLDYRQRVTSHKRNTFTDDQQGNSGLYALNKVIENSRKAMGTPQQSFFEIGKPFDALVVDADTPILAVCSSDNLLSTIVYAADASMYLGTMVSGEWRIRNGKHLKNASIKNEFIAALRALKNR